MGFGALASNPSPEAFIGAVGLAIGIGLQNIPEGAALSIPIRTDGKSRLNAFYWGSMSAIVEPLGALLGAVAVLSMTAILPYALSFAAGAMIFVVVGRVDPRFPDQWQHRCGDLRPHGWLCHYDDPRRRFGIRN